MPTSEDKDTDKPEERGKITAAQSNFGTPRLLGLGSRDRTEFSQRDDDETDLKLAITSREKT